MTINRILALVLFYPICGLVSLAILANASSKILENSFPSFALKINPINVAARQNLVLDALKTPGQKSLLQSKEFIQDGIKQAPSEATLHSLLGVVEEELGNQSNAKIHYNAALSLNSTDRLALIRSFSLAIDKKDFVSAVNSSDLIFRRWPTYWSSIEPFLPLMLSSANGFAQAVKVYSVSPAIRDRIIAVLSNNPNTLYFAGQLMRQWKSQNQTIEWRLINRVTNNMILSSDPAAANLFFRAMLTKEMVSEAKYIFNGNFKLDIAGNMFNWRIKKQPGVSQKLKHQAGENSEPNSKGRSLEIKFLDSPVQYRGLSQIIVLPPGQFQFNIEYSSRNLKTPKPIRANVTCLKPKKVLAKFELSAKESELKNGQFKFSIPRENCSLQEVYFDSEFVSQSWRNRFKGTLDIQSVTITSVRGE